MIRRPLNPILEHPGTQDAIAAMTRSERGHLARLLLRLQLGFRAKADLCWQRRKAPMAAYWWAASVYCGHIARALKRQGK